MSTLHITTNGRFSFWFKAGNGHCSQTGECHHLVQNVNEQCLLRRLLRFSEAMSTVRTLGFFFSPNQFCLILPPTSALYEAAMFVTHAPGLFESYSSPFCPGTSPGTAELLCLSQLHGTDDACFSPTLAPAFYRDLLQNETVIPLNPGHAPSSLRGL